MTEGSSRTDVRCILVNVGATGHCGNEHETNNSDGIFAYPTSTNLTDEKQSSRTHVRCILVNVGATGHCGNEHETNNSDGVFAYPTSTDFALGFE